MAILRPSTRIWVPGNRGVSVIAGSLPASSGDWWTIPGQTCLLAYQPKGASNYAASLVNLANPGTYDAYAGSAPGWTSAAGWDFTASPQRLYTGLNAVGDYTAILRCVIDGPGSGTTYGRLANTVDNSWIMMPNITGTLRQWFNGGGVTQYAGALSGAHVLAMYGWTAYIDGATEAVNVGVPGASEIIIGNRNDGTRTFDGQIYAVAIYDDTLSLAQVNTLAAQMNAL